MQHNHVEILITSLRYNFNGKKLSTLQHDINIKN